MRKPFVAGVGGVLSADIAVPDHERELDFYSKILTTGESPLWREDLMNNLGTPVIGLGARTPEYDRLPLQWMPHFQVADVAASVGSAIELGGKALMHDDQNRWAVLTDQVGAAFGVIPVVTIEQDATDQPENTGCISWLSLAVQDAVSSQKFYESVLGWSGKGWSAKGWSAKPIEPENSERQFEKFEMLIDDETAAAAICKSSDEIDIPSVWIIHLPVGDLAESLQRVGEYGGEVVKEFVDAKYAVIRDPVGVYLALQAGW